MHPETHLCRRYQQAAHMLSKRWTSLIVKALLASPLHFNQIAEQLETISDRVLSERLKELITEGIIERKVYAECPVRIEYALTTKGKDLAPIIGEIERWSQRWIVLPTEEVPSADPLLLEEMNLCE
ncbi:winged helix-turn-helix transcriptional regulator [Tengunoibacter tsumagoiensis]|uniref:Putative HTH-type transcriptional regulator YvaP n=1 Tax=Tengunoibacter tsumagoiensis TaxID=2014871 RepID=A0A402A9Z0_9CHLR|nr:helix-turn-helix domain-containing protein [Tengunoibacter tsumagoiensis]GCE15997.1 putative HTH-type transcriptional regulator YvaP [Tengunoibacter tsumagoiensis]